MFVVVAYIRGPNGKLTPWLREETTFSEVRGSDLRVAFSSRVEVRRHAEKEIDEGADEVRIFELAGFDDARKAIAASRMGDGLLIDALARRATPKEIFLTELAEREDLVAKEAEYIARRWLQAYATKVGWFALPAKRKVAKDKDAWLGPKHFTFGEALKSFMASATPAHKFVMQLSGEPWPLEPDGDVSLRDAILCESTRRIAPGIIEFFETEGEGPDF